MADPQGGISHEDEMIDAFRAFDTDNDGFITKVLQPFHLRPGPTAEQMSISSFTFFFAFQFRVPLVLPDTYFEESKGLSLLIPLRTVCDKSSCRWTTRYMKNGTALGKKRVCTYD